jgi:RNA polymerase sigma factor (sigma-70 family)
MPGVENDRDLVLALRARRPGAFDRLYLLYHGRIWRYLTRLAGPGAEDLFQETWMAAARNAHLLRDETTLLPWLFTIAHNKYRNSMRAWGRQVRMRSRLAGLPSGSQATAPDESVHLQREIAKVHAAFARLPDSHREVLLLCVVEGLDATEAAAVLGCSSEVVRKRLSRARSELARVAGVARKGASA